MKKLNRQEPTMDNGVESNIKVSKSSKIPRQLTEYYFDGYKCKIIDRNGKIGLFAQFNNCDLLVAYEVIVIQSNKRIEFAPKAEDWGRLGWSFSSKKMAMKAFNSIAEYYSTKGNYENGED